MTDRITLTRSHVPNCACVIDDDGNNLSPDPVCEGWTKIVTKHVESIVAARVAELEARLSADRDEFIRMETAWRNDRNAKEARVAELEQWIYDIGFCPKCRSSMPCMGCTL